jgi:hypothetical protein
VAVGRRCLAGFLESFERSRDPGLNIDFKKEYSKDPVTQITRILHGSECDVYVVFCVELPIRGGSETFSHIYSDDLVHTRGFRSSRLMKSSSGRKLSFGCLGWHRSSEKIGEPAARIILSTERQNGHGDGHPNEGTE